MLYAAFFVGFACLAYVCTVLRSDLENLKKEHQSQIDRLRYQLLEAQGTGLTDDERKALTAVVRAWRADRADGWDGA